MEVKIIGIKSGMIFKIIPNKEFTFLIPTVELAEILGYKTTYLSNLTRRNGYLENVHYVTYTGDVTAFYKNVKKGSRLLTRLGVVALCSSLRTTKSKELIDWASIQSYEKLTDNKDSKAHEVLQSMLKDITQIQAPDIRMRLKDKIKELENLI